MIEYTSIGKKSFHGTSFLVNPEPLIYPTKIVFRQRDCAVCRYRIAAQSVPLQYYKDTTLDLLHYNGKQEIINNNRLLWIEDDKIHFKFEEITSLKELEWH